MHNWANVSTSKTQGNTENPYVNGMWDKPLQIGTRSFRKTRVFRVISLISKSKISQKTSLILQNKSKKSENNELTYYYPIFQAYFS